MARMGWWSAPFALSIAISGCRDPTQVTIDVRTDLACDDSLRTTIAFGKLGDALEDETPTVDTKGCQRAGDVGTIVATPSGADDELFAVRVVTTLNGARPSSCVPGADGSLPDQCIVQRRSLHFIPHASLSLPVDMRARCRGVSCPVQQTCGPGGQCVDATIADADRCLTGTCRDTQIWEGGAGSGGSSGAPADGGDAEASAGTGGVAGSDAGDSGSDASACVPTGAETCNGHDDDCDGTVDDVADLGAECAGLFPGAGNVARWKCNQSCLVQTCASGFGNCDGQKANGCETTLGALPHCGKCNDCSDAPTCVGTSVRGYDAPSSCNAGACVRSTFTDTPCPGGANGSPACSGGHCALACDSGWGNCDSQASSGCEAPLDALPNCGKCREDCSPAPAATCLDATTLRTFTSPGTCTASACSYTSADTSCAEGCAAGACATTTTSTPTSCRTAGPGRSDCGLSGNEDCCTSLLVTGGTFTMTDPDAPATTQATTVSDFKLDKYEVTVGRFRKFVDAWVGGWRPAHGAGKHTTVHDGDGLSEATGGFEQGWDESWESLTSEWSASMPLFHSTQPEFRATPSIERVGCVVSRPDAVGARAA